MRITREMIAPSREDAVRINRQEKMAMIVMSYVATVYDDMRKELENRLGMIPDGREKMAQLEELADELLNELRLTIPMNQRMNLQNTAMDFEIRLVPKLTPSSTSIIMQKEEFKELVDQARAKCRECAENDEDCEKCGLYRILTVLLPLDDYHNGMLCPYNLGEWAN